MPEIGSTTNSFCFYYFLYLPSFQGLNNMFVMVHSIFSTSGGQVLVCGGKGLAGQYFTSCLSLDPQDQVPSESGSPIVRFANPLVKVASGSGNLTGSPIAMNVPIGCGLGNLSSAALPALLCFNRILTRAGGCTRTCWRIGSIAAQLAWHQESSLWAGNDDSGHCHSEMVLMVGCRSGSARYTTEFLATGSTSWVQGSQVGTGW